MISVRVGYWAGGLLAVVLIAIALQHATPWTEAGPLVVFLAWGLLGIAGEVASLIRSIRTGSRSGEAPGDATPPDGEVGIIHVAAIVGEPNSVDPRVRRFDRLEPAAPLPHRRVSGSRRGPRLLGRIVWISMFVGRDGQGWSDEEIAQAYSSMRRAGAWLEREAIRWGASVNIELADTYFAAVDDAVDEAAEVALVTHGDRYVPADLREPEKLLIGVSRAAARLGFRDAIDWMAAVQGRVEADVRVWMVHVRRGGCSQVVVQDDTEIGTVRLAVCYGRERLYPEPLRKPPYVDPVTVAHEVLHLFEATDKYEVPLRSFPARTVTSRDVMRLSETRLSRLRIDPRTASEIGWI